MPDSLAVPREKFQVKPEAVFEALQQSALARLGLVGSQCRLDAPDSVPVHVLAGKLISELIQTFQSAAPINQVCVRNRVSRSRKEVGHTHLVSDTARDHDERQVKRTRHLFEHIAKKDARGVLSVRRGGHSFTSRRPSMPSSRWLGKNHSLRSQ